MRMADYSGKTRLAVHIMSWKSLMIAVSTLIILTVIMLILILVIVKIQ